MADRLGVALLVVLLFSTLAPPAPADTLNGRDLSDTRVPRQEILRDGPPRDGIPAIDRPRFVAAGEIDFPVSHLDRRDHPKGWVIGVEIGGCHKVYPFSVRARASDGEIRVHFACKRLIIEFDRARNTARIVDGDGALVAGVTAFRFVWMAFHPDPEVYQARQSPMMWITA